MKTVVHKFGGTSLATPERLLALVEIIKSRLESERVLVVVSAMAGVTNAFENLIGASAGQSDQARRLLCDITSAFKSSATELLSQEQSQNFSDILAKDQVDLEAILGSISLVGKCSEQNHDYLIGMGEVWTAQLVNALFKKSGIESKWLDAREILIVENRNNENTVDFKKSQQNLNSSIQEAETQATVITGFVAKTADGAITTLGRNGSDYSASLFGNFLDAHSVHIWTDVDGVMSGDPRIVPEVEVISELTYQEATELAYFGAKVVHLKTMLPALEKDIPIWIKNSFHPEKRGTKICSEKSDQSHSRVKGFTTIGQLCLLNVEGRGMIGVPGIAARLFGAMNDNGISVVLISQASSEFSICFAIPMSEKDKARDCAEKEFHREISLKMIEKIEIEEDCTILAAVGDQMVGTVGVSAKLFSALGKAGVNIRAIAQGSSERNISVVIKEEDSVRALRAVHSAFYLSNQTLSIGIIGTGVVGSALINQLQSEAPLLKKAHVDLRVRGLTNSRKMLLAEKELPLENWSQQLQDSAGPAELAKFVDSIQVDHIPHAVLIDCTTSETVASQYQSWLERGIHIITPNKKAPTFPIKEYRALKAEGKKMSSHLLYETTVGAGLPIIGTLKELIQTGDEVLQIEGVLSGTLAYLFYHFDGERPFSEIVKEAREQGFTEPDPRDDLSGMDIVRKVVILAREIGMELETDQIKVDSLVPPELENVSVDEFMAGLPKFDDQYTQKIKEAKARNEVLRYVGIINPSGESRVELRSYDSSHPFSRIKATDNIVAFQTRRYNQQPLIIQGP
ncbi:MAG: bifunctional aspartate kinase/homoserine dehydrogenase I, partial [Halobacteriovoraceae bacterium]|nr:bifunctional aspartate kinase/homoserine dehydrogenase I [Halobacteriovoraceae bacterium]